MSRSYKNVKFEIALHFTTPGTSKKQRLDKKFKRVDKKHHKAVVCDSHHIHSHIEDKDYSPSQKAAYKRHKKRAEKQHLKKALDLFYGELSKCLS